IDDSGRYVFRSGETSATLTAAVIDRSFYALDYVGSRRSMLLYLWMGLPRVPFIRETAYWEDCVDLRPLLAPWRGWLADLVGPFVPYPLAGTRTTLRIETSTNHHEHTVAHVTTDIAVPHRPGLHRADAPTRIVTTLAPYKGITRIQVTSPRGTTVIKKTPTP
ncbi:MAG: hypothetical protein HQ559_14020, partial [Lentisphaerae bacterium]|nr:hypothetical protein [Lentisphaerota bacterium]